ncbi:MAG: DUF5642 family protein [Mycobacteriaceae bacterium]|nr:DUF5642 family protein [Mycobacteriaceae bacterium]
MGKAVLVLGSVCWLAGCGWGAHGSASSVTGNIAKIADVRSSFGPEFQVTAIAPRAIAPAALGIQKLPDGLRFEPAHCGALAAGPALPPGLQGNMAAVSAEGSGNRFVALAVETSAPLPANEPASDCRKVAFVGGHVRGITEVIDAPQIAGAHTSGVHRVLQTIVEGTPRAGELYDYSARFGGYQVIVIANPLVLQGKPVVAVDLARARELLVKAVAAVRS